MFSVHHTGYYGRAGSEEHRHIQSLEHGRDLEHLATQTEDEKRRCMQMVRDLHQRYMAEYGSLKCADVHMKIFGRTFEQWDENDFQVFLRMGGHVDKCTAVVGNVARWTVEILSKER